MDPSLKKRKADENGAVFSPATAMNMTPEDARKIIEPFSTEQLLDILQSAVVSHPDVLDAVRSVADRDPTQRKLFVRGLGWETNTDGLRSLFSSYGEIEEAVVIADKATGKSKGYGFVTFKHTDGALLALKEPSKKIDGRVTVSQLAAAGPAANAAPATDVSMRKIYVGNVPFDMPSDRLLALFASYGEIEEGPMGFDKQTGKSRGFALFVYKTVEASRAALVEPVKNVEGHQMVCKLAIEGKKGKPGGGTQDLSGAPGNVVGNGVGLPNPSPMPSSLPGQYGGPGGFSSYGGLSGFPGGNPPIQTAVGGVGGQSALGSGNAGGFGANLGGTSGPGGFGAGLGGGSYGSTQYGGPGAAGYGGSGSSSMYQLPPTSVGMPSTGYPEAGHYGFSSSAYQSQHQPQTGSSLAPRAPSGGMYQGMPPYY